MEAEKDLWVDSETLWYRANKKRLDNEYELQRQYNQLAHERLYKQWQEDDTTQTVQVSDTTMPNKD